MIWFPNRVWIVNRVLIIWSINRIKFEKIQKFSWSSHEQRSVSIVVVCCPCAQQPLIVWVQIQLLLISSYWNSRGPRSQSPRIRWKCLFGHCSSLAVALPAWLEASIFPTHLRLSFATCISTYFHILTTCLLTCSVKSSRTSESEIFLWYSIRHWTVIPFHRFLFFSGDFYW